MTEKNRQALVVLKDQLKLMDAGKFAKCLMYSRQKIYEYGDKPGKQLVKLLEQKESYIIIPNMCLEQGEEICHPWEKLILFQEFLSTLYTFSNPEVEERTYLKEVHLPQIKKEYRKVMERQLMQLEIEQAIHELKTGKAPGMDGFIGVL